MEFCTRSRPCTGTGTEMADKTAHFLTEADIPAMAKALSANGNENEGGFVNSPVKIKYPRTAVVGRPKILPDYLHPLDSSVANAPELRDVRLKAVSCTSKEQRKRRREEKANAKAEELIRQRGANKLQQLLLANTQQKIKLQAEQKRLDKKQQEADSKEKQIQQALVAVKSGSCVVEDLPEPLRKQVKQGLKKKRPHTTLEMRTKIRTLVEEGNINHNVIARNFGVAPSTINYIINHEEGRVNHSGRPKKLTDEMEQATARFMFLFHGSTLSDAKRFLLDEFKVDLSTQTIRRGLKSLGFRMGDFKRYPRDRNSTKAVQQRKEYATIMPEKYSLSTLFQALYSDEMSVVDVKKRRGYSIKGWYPTMEEEVKLSGAHITLTLVASAEVGIIWFSLKDGSVSGPDVLKTYQSAVQKFVAKEPVSQETNYDPSIKRAFIVDNAGNHHNSCFREYFQGDEVGKFFGLEYLPVYSPFLNPVEEIFAILRYRMFKEMFKSNKQAYSREAVKDLIVQEVGKITKEEVHKCYLHAHDFLQPSRAGTAILSQHLFEDTHCGDEAGTTEEMRRRVDQILDKYLPNDYSIYTRHANPAMHKYRNKVIDPEVLDSAAQEEEERKDV